MSRKDPRAILKNPALLRSVLDQVVTKLSAHREPLKAAKDQVLMFTRLVRAWADGSYRDVPWKSVMMMAGALLYFLNPFDLIPDLLAGGFIDDLTVLSSVAAAAKADLDAFIAWERGKSGAHSGQ